MTNGTLKKEKICVLMPSLLAKEKGMSRISPTIDGMYILRAVKDVHEKVDPRASVVKDGKFVDCVRRFGTAKIGGVTVEVWQNTNDTYWEIS